MYCPLSEYSRLSARINVGKLPELRGGNCPPDPPVPYAYSPQDTCREVPLPSPRLPSPPLRSPPLRSPRLPSPPLPSVGTGGDSQSLLEWEPLRSKDRCIFSYNIDTSRSLTRGREST